MIESLVAQIEARFAELGRQMTDPEVINDRQRYAEVGREYARLEGPARLAEALWRRAADDVAGAQEMLAEAEDPEVREMLATARARTEELDEELRLAMVERDPADDKDVIIEIQGGAGGEEAGIWAGDIYRMLTKYAERLGFKVQPLEVGDGKYTFGINGDAAYSVFSTRAAPSRPARPGHRVAGAHPHLDRDGRRAPRGRGGRRPHRPVRPADRRLPLVGPGRAVGEHDRLGRAHHPQAQRRRRLDAGREEPAAEP